VVGLAQAFHVLVAIAHEPDLDLVLAVERERVVDERSAARADWQPLEVLFLRDLRGHADRLAAGGPGRTSDGRPAAFFTRRDVAVEQRGREGAGRAVVEPEAGLVGGA